MKKTLLIGSALVIGFAGFSQNGAKKAGNLMTVRKSHNKAIVAEGQSHSNINWRPWTPKNVASSSSSCSSSIYLSSSWNPNGVVSVDAANQNPLSYNQNLNAIAWMMRGSVDWTAAFPTSGGYQATILQNVTSSPSSTIAPNTKDTVALFRDASTNTIGARYPGSTWLNPVGNTDWHKAYGTIVGPYNAGSTWLGTVYVAKPFWSQSAVNHAVPTSDSLYTVNGSTPFYYCAGSAEFFGVPNTDPQQLGNTWMATGSFIDLSVPATSSNLFPQYRNGFIAKATITSTVGVVNWSIDTTAFSSIKFYKGSCGYLNSGNPRMAFGPDGQTGYAVFQGRLDTTFGNFADSAYTPILFKTTNGGATWTHLLPGYDWMCNHPEVKKNLGKGTLGPGGAVGNTSSPNNIYQITLDHGLDLAVDANNVLHYVATVSEAYHRTVATTTAGVNSVYSFDSLSVLGFTYNYDNINYHPIIWDFMTDGTQWSTMMIDSLQSSSCGEAVASDTTASYSAWTAASGNDFVGAHISVSRSVDGTKIFVGWADTPAGVTGIVNYSGQTINPNTNPDIFVKGYDVNTKKLTATTDITPGLGNCFFPFLSDFCYYDSTQSAWVTPAAYAVGRAYSTSSLGFTVYNGDGTTPATGVNYFYANCGSFTQSDFNVNPTITSQMGSPCYTGAGIKTYENAFASSISNYPNPFNNTTTIVVNLTESKPVSIKVYNTIGAVVFTKTIDGNVGTNNVTFDGGQVSSGVYYYTVTAGSEQATKKMIIQK